MRWCLIEAVQLFISLCDVLIVQPMQQKTNVQ